MTALGQTKLERPVSAPMLQVALDFAELGMALLPTGPDCKPGRLRWDGTASGFIGVHDATRDPELIEAYWSTFPQANITAACGAPSGVFVLDVDVKDSAGVGFDGRADLDRLQERFGELPRTWLSSTPSTGEHQWYRQPDRPLTNRVHMRVVEVDGSEVKTGLDVRTVGGCVPLPPSAKATGSYRWVRDPLNTPLADAPEWLLDIIDPPLPPRTPIEPVRITTSDRTARYVEAAVNGECVAVAQLGARQGRNQRLFEASANLGEFVGAGLLRQAVAEGALERAADECGLTREDGLRAVQATIASGMRKGLAHPREVSR